MSAPIRAITFDYWDTIYAGHVVPERVARREAAIRRLLETIEQPVPENFTALYRAASAEADRWWREEQRGYTTQERIRWMLARMDVERPEDCVHVARAVQEVDDALMEFPAALLPGAGDALARLAARFQLGIISDTGFASGRAQDRLLERDQLRSLFAVTVYSMDIGHAKPRPEPFDAAVDALGVAPQEIVHVGDSERTDVRGALAAGLRAIRLDIVHSSGPSAAEHVARSYGDVVQWVERA